MADPVLYILRQIDQHLIDIRDNAEDPEAGRAVAEEFMGDLHRHIQNIWNEFDDYYEEL